MALIVPRLEGSVQQQGLPNPRIDSSAPLEAFGGGAPLNRAADAVEGAAKATFDFYQDQKKRADDVVVQDKLTALERRQVDTLHGQKGAFWEKGKNAMALVESHYQPFQSYQQELEQDLDPDQLYLFRKRAAAVDNETYQSIIKHMGLQIGDYSVESSKNYRAVQLEKGTRLWNVEGSEVKALSEAERSLRGEKDRDGKDDNYVPTELRKFGDNLIRGRVQAQLDAGVPEMADIELRRWRTDSKLSQFVSEETYSDLDKAVRSEMGNKKGRSLGEGLFQKHTDPVDALAEARRITDKSLRESAVERIDELTKEGKTRQENSDDTITQKLSNFILQTGGAQDLPRADLLRLTPEKKSWVIAFKEKVLNGKDDEQDNGKWNQMLDIARSGGLAKMSRSEFAEKYWSHFDKEHRSRADTLWLESKKDKPGPAFKSALTQDDMIRNAMVRSGFIDGNETPSELSAEQVNRKAAIEQALNQQMESYFHSNNKNAGDDVKKKMIDEIIMNQVFVKKSFLGIDALSKDTQIPAAAATPGERGSTYLPIDRIPNEVLALMVNKMRSKQIIDQDVTDQEAAETYKDRIQRAAAAAMSGAEEDEIIQILRGQD